MIYRRKLLLSVTLILLGYLAWVLLSDLDAVLAAVQSVGIAGILIICLFSLVNYGLRFLRWQWYLNRLGSSVPLGNSLTYYLAGFALTTTPGKAGEAVRSLYLRGHGVSYHASLAALFAERIADVLAVTAIAAAGLSVFSELLAPALMLLLLAVALIFLLNSGWMHELLGTWLGPRLSKRFAAAVNHGLELMNNSRQLLGFEALLPGIAIGIAAWGAEAWAFAYLIDLLGYDLPYYLCAAIYAIAMLAGAASFMPGGLGGAEAAMAVMLKFQGFSAADAVAATLICRMCTLWLAVGIGALAMLVAPPERVRSAINLLDESGNS